MVTQLTLAQACEAMIRYKIAAGKSTHTISDYRNSFKKLMLFLPGSTKFTSITRSQLIDFFAWLQEEYETIVQEAMVFRFTQRCPLLTFY